MVVIGSFESIDVDVVAIEVVVVISTSFTELESLVELQATNKINNMKDRIFFIIFILVSKKLI